jgi:hypothetical protein
MLHRLHTLDYGRKVGSHLVRTTDELHPVFFLAYINIVGRPLQPITRRSERLFDDVTISFQHWHAPYRSKHLPFDLEHRTFQLAWAATRETWFIVMHPVVAPVHESRQRKEGSALQAHHAEALASYIKAVEPLWVLDGPTSQNITYNEWTAFQDRFVADWDDHVRRHSYDPFWLESQPAFHVYYDYGANIEIQVTEGLQSLTRETRLRPDDESSSGSDEEDENEDGNEEDENDSAHEKDKNESANGEGGGEGNQGGSDGGRESDESEGEPNGERAEEDTLYTTALRKLLRELKRKHILDHISSISYTLAVDLHCVDLAQPDRPASCLLADRNVVAREYGRPGDFTFYPLAFHPAYGNFSSAKPPKFLADHVLAIMKDNLSYQNDGGDVLSGGYFQAFSNIKRCSPKDQGTATAALTLPTVEGKVPPRQQRLLGRLQGVQTPDDPGASKPYARERRCVEQAIHDQEFAYRMEQVLSIDVTQLISEQRHFGTILRPIFQLMRFYLQEARHYTHVLRSFPPSIFPKILGAFARIFELATDEMQRQFQAQGSKGLGLALSEGVAALDRLGHYCSTGLAKPLLPSVGTIDGGWPYLAPQMLDLRHGGSLDKTHWPRTENGRPMLMHVASLGFHYGPDVAADRHSQLWFKELGVDAIRGPRGATTFLGEVFRDLWVPQMKRFVRHQILRRLVQKAAKGRAPTPAAMEKRQRQQRIVHTWSQSTHPFSWPYVSPLVRFPSLTDTGITSPSPRRRRGLRSPADVVRTWRKISIEAAWTNPNEMLGHPSTRHGIRSSRRPSITRRRKWLRKGSGSGPSPAHCCRTRSTVSRVRMVAKSRLNRSYDCRPNLAASNARRWISR